MLSGDPTCRSPSDKQFLEQMVQQRKALEAQIASMKRHIPDVSGVSLGLRMHRPERSIHSIRHPASPPPHAVWAGAILLGRTRRRATPRTLRATTPMALPP